MKKLVLLIVFLTCHMFYAPGQSVIRSTVGSGGSSQNITVKGKTYYISQSIGQASVIGAVAAGGRTLRQGYQQPPYLSVGRAPLSGSKLITLIYPNPFSQSITIAFDDEITEDITIHVIDVSGKILLSKSYAPSESVTVLLEDIANGSYFISVSSGERQVTTTLIKR